MVLLDTAGRTSIDEELMQEVADVKAATNPHEILLVVDALTGQDAVNTAKAFDSRLAITGTVLTRADGDGRGGAALSMRAVTGKPIKLLGTGEKWDALEDFDPKRIAGRILGMGDIVGLVEKAAQSIDVEKAKAIAEKMKKGEFDLDDLAEQLKQMEKIGGMGGVLGMLPGIGKIKAQINEAGLDKSVKRQRAMISSMTPKERRSPKILDAKRKRRIAAGSGTTPAEVNKLLKMHVQMADMMKAMGKNKGGLARMFGMGGGGGPSEAEMAAMQDELGRLDPKALEQLPADLKDALPKGLAVSVAARSRKDFRASAADRCQASVDSCPGSPSADRARRSDERRLGRSNPGVPGRGDATSTNNGNGRRRNRTQCPSRSGSRAVAPRSVPTITSSSPARSRRVTAATSSRSAPSIRCSRRMTPTA